MKPAIEVVKERCSGCFGCFNVCPSKAISMELNAEGFYVPIIDKTKCVGCGKCQEICPLISLPVLERFQEPLVYASWSKDERIRLTSSSGGVFTELARTILNKGGVVYGVVWSNDFVPIHVRAESLEVLEGMKGSKYIQSYVGETYHKIIEELDDGIPILFSGTPCQIAALNKIVKEKTYSNLYTVDIVCLGVPSLTFFKKYIMCTTDGRKIKSIDMRDKSKGWSKYQINIKFEDGTSYVSSYRKDSFFFGYLSTLFLNHVCYNCPLSQVPRQGDVTLGDFWGIGKPLRDERGVSVVLINSANGEELVRSTSNLMLFPFKLQDATKCNRRIINGKLKKPNNREMLIKVINETECKKFIEILEWEKTKYKFMYIMKLPYLALKRMSDFCV
ncbi:MAG: Coenzyme F420 hydrogenase/dehydrogenase, beta subunit C-terminal domain [Candidatus Bathyarchaeia archaeon]